MLVYLLLGTLFGILLSKAEIVSWFRMQEMFRFQSFHMYGVLGSAVAVGSLSLQLLRRARLKTFAGDPIEYPPKAFGTGRRYLVGGTLFGIGWAFTGACPGPLFALLGQGVSVMLVTLAAALLGTWTYARLRSKLPH